jgi:general secretion pathway protein N
MARTARPRGSPSPGWGWAAAGALSGALLGLVMFAPARWLAAGLEAASRGQLRLAEARGSVWDGSARVVLTGGTGSSDAIALPDRVHWRLSPRWNGAAAQVRAACCMAQPASMRVHVGFGTQALTIGDSSSRWPAALLAGLGTPWNTVQPQGDLLLSTRGLSVEWAEGRVAVAGRAELVAQDLSSRLSTLRPMGSYRIILQGGATPTLRLDTLDGSLRLTGSGQWVGSRLRFSGEATAAPEREAALSNLLNIIGRRSGPRSIITIG